MRRTETFHKIRELLDNPKTTAEDLAAVIVEDKALAGSLMHFIKSFGFPTKVCTLTRAVSLLGFDAIRSMVTEYPNQ